MTREPSRRVIIDALQFCEYTPEVFEDLRAGGVDAIHVTIAYHESFREAVANVSSWNRRFERFGDFIFPGRTAADVIRARAEGRTAVFFGMQNPSPLEDDVGLVKVWYDLGVRFMQLSYNNQSLLAAGCYEAEDGGITRMGREVIAEMNRVGMVIDMSHSATRSTLQAIEISTRPIAVTHANPATWHSVPRNKPDDVLRSLAAGGGMFGFSLYPHHLAGGSACRLSEFAEMVARTAETIGVEHLGIGSDLCQGQPDHVVRWMRSGRWKKEPGLVERDVVFPEQPSWFRSNRDLQGIGDALADVGFSRDDVDAILGGNWLRFFEESFGALQPHSAGIAARSPAVPA